MSESSTREDMNGESGSIGNISMYSYSVVSKQVKMPEQVVLKKGTAKQFYVFI